MLHFPSSGKTVHYPVKESTFLKQRSPSASYNIMLDAPSLESLPMEIICNITLHDKLGKLTLL